MIILVTGGVRSGKSSFAERLIHALAPEKDKYYIATAVPYDDEMVSRIAHHQQLRRDKGFITVEQPYDVGEAAGKISGSSTVLLECIGTLTTNELIRRSGAGEPFEGVPEMIYGGVMELAEKAKNLVMVSNEVFSEGGSYDSLTEKFIDSVGQIHCGLVRHADIVVECVYGIVVVIKGEKLLKEVRV